MLLFWLLLLLAALQCVMAARFCLALRRPLRPLPADADCPRARIFLSLRGADPYLDDVLVRLIEQDYPNFDLQIVVDSAADPAAEVVREALSKNPGRTVKVGVLSQPRITCTLKISALLQTVRALEPEVEVLALCDADTLPHRTWLRELVAPLADKNVVVSTTGRWYMPAEPEMGSLVRYLYNAGSLVHAWMYGFGWAGTMAIKTSFLRDSDLMARWEQAMADDTLAGVVAQSYGLRQVFVPSLVMINRESCDVPGFLEFCKRQLLSVRLEHPAWPAVLGLGWFTTAVLLAAILSFVENLFTLQWSLAGLLLFGLLIYVTAMAAILAALEFSVQGVLQARRKKGIDWLDGTVVMGLLMAAPLAQLAYAWALWLATSATSFRWRGIEYQIVGRTGIRMREYVPYEPAEADEATTSSASLR